MSKKILSIACLLLACAAASSCVQIVRLPDQEEAGVVILPEGAVEVYSAYPNLQYLVPGEFNLANRPSYVEVP